MEQVMKMYDEDGAEVILSQDGPKHRTEYDGEFYQKVNMDRIFNTTEGEVDYTETLLAVRQVVVKVDWSDVLDKVLNSLLWWEETGQGFANRIGVTKGEAGALHDQGYRTLQRMVKEGLISPVFKEDDG